MPREKDLLGVLLSTRRLVYSRLLERYDRSSFEARRERLEHFRKTFPRGIAFMMPLESHAVFSEIQIELGLNAPEPVLVELQEGFDWGAADHARTRSASVKASAGMWGPFTSGTV